MDVDITTADVMQLFVLNNNDFSLFLDIKGVSTPPTFFRFSAVDYLSASHPRASACHSHIMCIIIVHITHKETC